MSEVICSSCAKPKDKLIPTPSKLMPIRLYLCQSCVDRQLEPRFTIILRARTDKNLDAVADYIKDHRYLGNTITAEEVTV